MSEQNLPYIPTDYPWTDQASLWERRDDLMKKLKIKQPIWLIVAWILFFVILYFIADRIQLIQVGEHVIGNITNITAYNSRCGWKHKHDCTEFTAYVGFKTIKWESSTFSVWGGNSTWHNQPIASSYRKIWWEVKVIYDPNSIVRVYEDTLWWIWGVPIMTFFFQIMTFFSAFSEPKKKTSY